MTIAAVFATAFAVWGALKDYDWTDLIPKEATR